MNVIFHSKNNFEVFNSKSIYFKQFNLIFKKFGGVKLTAQVLIITKESVVCSSDQAATMSDGKTYDGMRKIFKLSDLLPAEIMFNGNADFENFSMETLISKFTNTADFEKLETIEKVKDEFLRFLSLNTQSTDVNEYLEDILYYFKEDLISKIDSNGFEEVIGNARRKKVLPFIKDYSNFSGEFLDIIPDDVDKQEVNHIIWEMFCHELSFDGTGVIFAGFDIGHDFPSFFEINIHCNNHGEIVYEEVDSRVNCHNPYLKVFAINEEAYTFITGVNSNFEEDLKEYVVKSNKIIIENIRNLLEKENIDEIDKIIDICNFVVNEGYSDLHEYVADYKMGAVEFTSVSIEYLPRWLLCDLADYLIQLTALKQKISSEIESVSIDADVTLMTKYDGFKWVKYNYKRV